MVTPTRGARIWGAIWRMLTVTLLGVLASVTYFAINVSLGADEDSDHFGLLLLGDIALGVVTILLVPLRRRAPRTIGILTAITGSFSVFAAPAALLILVSVATRRRAGEIVPVAVTWLIGMTVANETGITFAVPAAETPADTLLAIAAALAVVTAAVGIGLAIGNRRDLLLSLRERARLAERERDIQEARIREQERTQIAREMHDVLAHQLSIVAMHAGALRERTDLPPQETAAAVAVIHDHSHQALDDLREVLGALREPASPVPDTPQPQFSDIPSLIAAHPDARLTLAIDTAALPSALGRHAYRIVQECLTNARKHAPGREARVQITGEPGGELRIDVSNAVSGTSSSAPGFGLIGIDERARSLGGSHAVTRTAELHRVEVLLPWPAT